jgi:hypothetical protein
MRALFGSLHRKHAALLTLAVLGAIPYGWAALGSLLLAGGIQMVNLRALDRTATRLGEFGRAGDAISLRVLLGLRFVLVVGLVGVALFLLPVQPAPFVIGLSLVIPAVIWHGFDTARRGSLEGR